MLFQVSNSNTLKAGYKAARTKSDCATQTAKFEVIQSKMKECLKMS